MALNLPTTINRILLAALLLLTVECVAAAEIRVAVASNFGGAIKAIVAEFEAVSEHRVTPVFGSTGKHYAQIINGAPFDAFFAADQRRPRLLESEGKALSGSRFTYAVGQLVLWSPKAEYVDGQGRIVEEGDFRHLAIANPKLAPYGKAAKEVLQAQKLWDQLRGRMVRGENIGQTFQFVKSGNAALGFVAYSQIKRPGQEPTGSHWQVPLSLYQPIEQQAVQLTVSAAVHSFMDFVKSEQARAIIRGYGYGMPLNDMVLDGTPLESTQP